jgi:hypothetical protein
MTNTWGGDKLEEETVHVQAQRKSMYRHVLLNAREMFLKTRHKLNIKFAFKTVYFLRVRGLKLTLHNV